MPVLSYPATLPREELAKTVEKVLEEKAKTDPVLREFQEKSIEIGNTPTTRVGVCYLDHISSDCSLMYFSIASLVSPDPILRTK